MPDLPSFESCRSRSFQFLGDAADQIRAGDWDPPANADQLYHLGEAMAHIGHAKGHLDAAARAARRG